MSHADSRAREAARQTALLRALWRDDTLQQFAVWCDPAAPLRRGLQAYQANAGALAERALAAAFPVLQQVLGDEAFAHLARDFMRHHPPGRGDIACWGDALPTFVADAASLAEEPYLADLARLEWCVHGAAAAADAGAPDLQLLQLLGAADPDALQVQLRPGCAALMSPWPLAAIWLAHTTAGGDDPFAAVRAAFAQPQPRGALVWRDGWRVRVAQVPPAEAAFTAGLLSGCTLGQALDRPEAAELDFQAWLVANWQRGLLLGGTVADPLTEPDPLPS